MRTERKILIVDLVVAALLGIALGTILSPKCHAQDLPDKPQPQAEVINVSQRTFGNVLIHFTDHEDRVIPIPHETKDRNFWLAEILGGAVTVGDAEALHWAVRHGGQELNPIFGNHPSRLRIYGIMLPSTGFASYLEYRWKREDDALRAWGYPSHQWHWYHNAALLGICHGIGIISSLTGR